jgi:DNA-binding transcriptional LysR family regulator
MISDELDVSILQLRCFIAVVEAGSINAAARRIGIASPSVSRAIARLEKEAGIKLLHRSTHALSLTEEGEALLDPAREAVSAAGRFREVATGKANVASTGVVRISAPVAFARQVLCPLLPKFARLHPGIRLDVRMTNAIVDLAEEGIDLALRAGSLSRVPGHIQQSWFNFPWVVCAAPSYLAHRSKPEEPSHLDDHALIGFRNTRAGQVQGWTFQSPQTGTLDRYLPDAKFAFDDGDACWQAVLAGAGIGCAPLWLATEALREGHAVELLRNWRGARVNMSILRRDRRLTPPRVSRLQSFLLEHAPDMEDLL